jgi:hypothetical protein
VIRKIEPTHTMIIQINYKPKADAGDKALLWRNILMPFKASLYAILKKRMKGHKMRA